MNFYSDDTFCKALEAVYFPDRNVEPTLFELDGKIWKIPTVNSTQPIVKFPFPSTIIDFYEPYSPKSDHQIQKIAYIPKVCHGLVSSDEWFARELGKFHLPAPTVMWKNFGSWDEFVKHVKKKRSSLFPEYRRCLRKLGQEIGTVNFVFDDPRSEILEICIAWKSAQLLKTKTIDLFSHPEHIQLFRELGKQGLLVISSLSAGDKPIAASIGILAQGRFHGLVCAYDPAYGTYAPGRLMLVSLLEESFQRSHQEFDFMGGNEPYKWWFATHTRLISELGIPSLSIQINRYIESIINPVKGVIKSMIKLILPWLSQTFPGLKENTRNLLYKFRKKMYEITKTK